MMTIKRCPWANFSELEVNYHDKEWGVPVHDDITHFEFITLEGAQAGLSWNLILKKRENYRRLFDGFDPNIIARYDENKISQLLSDPDIVRNKLKINSTISNAKCFLEVQKSHGSFDDFIWSYVDGKPLINKWQRPEQVPAKTELSDRVAKDLKKLGFKFVGSTIMYSYLQATGLINDHLVSCFCYSKTAQADSK